MDGAQGVLLWESLQASGLGGCHVPYKGAVNIQRVCQHGSASLVAHLCPTLCNPVDCSPPGLCQWNSPGKNPGVGCCAFLQGTLNAGIEPASLTSTCVGRWVLYHWATWEARICLYGGVTQGGFPSLPAMPCL